jgi:hypothetical protein
MPIARALPPVAVGGNELLTAYHEALRRHWSLPKRAIGAWLARAGIGTGWSEAELGLLSEADRAAGLSSAARAGIQRLLNPAGYPLSSNMLRNKALFARHAAQHGLPVPATYDPASQGIEGWLEDMDAIIAKASYSSKGRGIQAFTRNGSGWHGPEGPVPLSRLRPRLEKLVASHGVVQELLVTHQAIADLSPGALPTLRIITCRNETGSPEACVSVLRLSAGGDHPVDNFSAGGLAVRIDRLGHCGTAFRASSDAIGEVTGHPATGARIEGREVPGFAEAIELALKAHHTLPQGFGLVGWDIGVSARGPVLIEGNWNPGTLTIQLAVGTGLDRTRLGELYRFHLRRVPEQQWRRARVLEW